jgi:hypothetical protein
MSEYQYYEFLALDRPLTPEQRGAAVDLVSRGDYGYQVRQRVPVGRPQG